MVLNPYFWQEETETLSLMLYVPASHGQTDPQSCVVLEKDMREYLIVISGY